MVSCVGGGGAGAAAQLLDRFEAERVRLAVSDGVEVLTGQGFHEAAHPLMCPGPPPKAPPAPNVTPPKGSGAGPPPGTPARPGTVADGYWDCQHFCQPGPVDMWNGRLVEIAEAWARAGSGPANAAPLP